MTITEANAESIKAGLELNNEKTKVATREELHNFKFGSEDLVQDFFPPLALLSTKRKTEAGKGSEEGAKKDS